MSRDMKPRRNQPAKKKSGGGTLIGMFIGLVLGVTAAAGVVWYMNKSPLPFVDKSPPPRSEIAAASNGKPAQPIGPARQAGRSDSRKALPVL
jgi:flagellar basal body-associated protein FliL